MAATPSNFQNPINILREHRTVDRPAAKQRSFQFLTIRALDEATPRLAQGINKLVPYSVHHNNGVL